MKIRTATGQALLVVTAGISLAALATGTANATSASAGVAPATNRAVSSVAVADRATTAGVAPAAITTHFTADGVRIRSCPSTSCTILGLGYRSHSVTGSCWTTGTVVSGNPYWDKIRDNTTRVTGYVSETLLNPDVLDPRCLG
jgi:hypothetical protein